MIEVSSLQQFNDVFGQGKSLDGRDRAAALIDEISRPALLLMRVQKKTKNTIKT